MTVVPEVDLKSALNVALNDAALGLPIAWENDAYTPVVGTAYLRVWNLPAETDVMTLGPEPWQEHKGIFQVSVFYPIGVGDMVPLAKAAAVVAVFRATTTYTYNTLRVICEKAWLSSARVEDNLWYHIPVNIRYRVESNA